MVIGDDSLEVWQRRRPCRIKVVKEFIGLVEALAAELLVVKGAANDPSSIVEDEIRLLPLPFNGIIPNAFNNATGLAAYLNMTSTKQLADLLMKAENKHILRVAWNEKETNYGIADKPGTSQRTTIRIAPDDVHKFLINDEVQWATITDLPLPPLFKGKRRAHCTIVVACHKPEKTLSK